MLRTSDSAKSPLTAVFGAVKESKNVARLKQPVLRRKYGDSRRPIPKSTSKPTLGIRNVKPALPKKKKAKTTSKAPRTL